MDRPFVAPRVLGAQQRSCYDTQMHEALWVVIVVAGICVLLFVLDLLGIASFIFSSSKKK